MLSTVQNRMANPLEAAAPFKHAINRRFQALPGTVSTQLAKRGFGKSGQLGSALKGVEFARNDAMADLEGRIDQSTLQLAMQLLGLGRGQSESGTSSGFTEYPGNKLGGGISGGLSGLGGAYGLGLFDKWLKPASGGWNPSGGYSPSGEPW